MSLIIKDNVYTEFLNQLTVDIIKTFIQRALRVSKGLMIQKCQMMDLFKNVFDNFPMFPAVYEQIFNRFRKVKCNVFNNYRSYFIKTISTEDKINIYELCCALTVFLKCKFEQKLRLLFELTDLDDDGFISEKELRKMINTLLVLFSNDTNTIQTNSSVLNQSLANINAKATIEMLLEYPGELGEVFARERYIKFEVFYGRLKLIPNYKVRVLPFFINFKDCLCTQFKEKILEMKKDTANDYLSISNEIILPMFSKDQSMDIRPPPQKNKLSKRKFSPLMKKKLKEKRGSIFNGSQKNIKSPEINKAIQPKEFRVTYLKIRNMEAKPGKIHLLPSRNGSLPNICRAKLVKRRHDYKSIEDLVSEMNNITNKKKIEDYSDIELTKIENKVRDKSVDIKKFLRSREYYADSNIDISSLSFRKLY